MFLIGLLVSAPVGHAATHSPQVTQDEEPMGSFRSNAIRVAVPLPLRPMTSLPWMSSQARTHRSQRMHASWSTAMTGLEVSVPRPEDSGQGPVTEERGLGSAGGSRGVAPPGQHCPPSRVTPYR